MQERIILAVERFFFSRGFLRWGGVLFGAVALVAAAYLAYDASQPKGDWVTQNAQMRAAGWIGLVGFVLLWGGVAAWFGLPPFHSRAGRPATRPDAVPGTNSDSGRA